MTALPNAMCKLNLCGPGGRQSELLMENLGNFKCPKCRCIHSAISEASAVAAVSEFNDYFLTLSSEAQAQFGGKPATLEMYRRCTRCGAPASSFLPAAPGDCWPGKTLQVVIVPAIRGGHA